MKRFFFAVGFLALLSTSCSGALAQPFAGMKAEPIYVYRLQDFEPPQASPASPLPAGGIQLPPQIQQWVGGAAQLLPPGLLPPGLLPGGTPASPAAANAPRFHNFRILGQAQITDQKQHDEILDLFGHQSNFQNPTESCVYAEFGFQIGQPAGGAVQGAPASSMPADILVSMSCGNVAIVNYGWPYGGATGISPDSEKRIYAIVQKAFGGT